MLNTSFQLTGKTKSNGNCGLLMPNAEFRRAGPGHPINPKA